MPHLALDSLEEVIEKVCDGLKQCESDPERLPSLTSFPHFRLSGLERRLVVLHQVLIIFLE